MHEYAKRPVYGKGINDIADKTRGVKYYLVWKAMLGRCYSDYAHIKNPTYIGYEVCDEWLILSKFKEWFDENYKEGCELDKDILCPGNRVYSPDTCCFVPKDLNMNYSGHKRKYGISVGVHKQCRRYVAEFRGGKIKHCKTFATYEEAESFYKNHYNAYKRELAKHYFGQGIISEKVYNAIVAYEL